MPNDYFRFKQFSVHQDRCGMKVTTDACIFGAWVPLREGAHKVLDVGAGTGLLSLMLAQRFPDVEIDAVEIDEVAAIQAAENFAASPFDGRIRVIHGDVRKLRVQGSYDLVISNPPFFSRAFQSGDKRKMNARHDNTLGMDELLDVADAALGEAGGLAVLWPSVQSELWSEKARERKFHLSKELCIHPVANARHTRTASVYTRVPGFSEPGRREVLYIADGDGGYTARCTDLLRPFYLKL